jgi:hypothetical protein
MTGSGFGFPRLFGSKMLAGSKNSLKIIRTTPMSARESRDAAEFRANVLVCRQCHGLKNQRERNRLTALSWE